MKGYNNFLLKYIYPWRRKIQLEQFKGWIEDATKNLELSGKKILVVACGPGFEIPLLSKKVGANGQIDAFDISEKMLIHAQKLVNNSLTNVKITLGDAEDKKNFPENLYDYVFIILGLSVIPDYVKTIELSYTALKDGGKIIILDSQTPKGLRGVFVNLYHKIFHAHNRPIAQHLKNKFVEQLYKIYPNEIYFLWVGVKNS